MSRTVNLGKIVPERGVDYWTETEQNEIISTATTNVENNFAPTIATIQSNSNNALNTANTANSTANTAKSIAEGANQALSYANYQAMITAFNELADNVYKVGQNIMIITLNVPDLWISAIENTSITYNYTNDETITTALSTNGYIQVGYYKLSALETQKVDLTDYYTKTGTENKIEDYLYQIMPTDSASGTIATINDSTTMFNAIDVSGTIKPVQDLHGYDSPWSAGGGKNLCPMVFNDIKTLNTYGTWTDNKYVFRGITLTIEQDAAGNCIGITANGTASQDISFTFTTPFELDGTYILSGCPSDGNGTTTYNVRILETGKGSVVTSDYGNGSTFTATKTVRARITIYNGYTASNLKFYPMLRLSSITDDTYAPYSNICPITGWTGASVVRTGKNLLLLLTNSRTVNGITITQQTDGGVHISGTATANIDIGLSPMGQAINRITLPKTGANTYCLSGCPSGGSTSTYRIVGYFDNKDNKYVGVAISDVGTGDSKAVPEETAQIRLMIQVKSGVTIDEVFYPQFELGSTATPYEPYQSETYDITFPSEAGTVYGGSLDVTTGVLTVDRAKLVLDGDESWQYYSVLQGNLFRAVGQPTPTIIANNVSDFLCDAYKPVIARTNGTLSSSSAGYLDFIDNGFNALDGWIAHVSQNNIHVVYPLAEPVTYQLTPQQISFLLGTNNLWVDTGDINVTYKADIQKYIDKKTN